MEYFVIVLNLKGRQAPVMIRQAKRRLEVAGRRILLIAPPTVHVDYAVFLYNHRSYAQRFFTRRLHESLEAVGADVAFMDCQGDPGAVLSIRGTRTAGPRSQEPAAKACFYHGIDRRAMARRAREAARPDEIWVTSGFTFEREAVRETIRIARDAHPGVPVMLGGVYPTLCPEDAAASGADGIHQGLLNECEQAASVRIGGLGFCIAGRGCPRKCSFCAQRFTEDVDPFVRPAAEIVGDVESLVRDGARAVMMYVASIFSGPSAAGMEAMLEGLASCGVSTVLFNGIQPGTMTPRRADLLSKAGVLEVNLPIQTSDLATARKWGRSERPGDLAAAIRMLEAAGFARERICSDVIVGHPGQTFEEAVRTMCLVWSHGISPMLMAYTLVPRSLDARRYGHLAKGLSLEELHPFLWPLADPSEPVRSFIDLFTLSRVLPENVETALGYLDPGSRVPGLVRRYLDEYGFGVPQYEIRAQLPPLGPGWQAFLSHPWELALVLARTRKPAAMLPILQRCEAVPVCEPLYLEVPARLEAAGLHEPAARTTRSVPSSAEKSWCSRQVRSR